MCKWSSHFHNLPNILTANKFQEHIFEGYVLFSLFRLSLFLCRKKTGHCLKCSAWIGNLQCGINDMFKSKELTNNSYNPKLKLVNGNCYFEFTRKKWQTVWENSTSVLRTCHYIIKIYVCSLLVRNWKISIRYFRWIFNYGEVAAGGCCFRTNCNVSLWCSVCGKSVCFTLCLSFESSAVILRQIEFNLILDRSKILGILILSLTISPPTKKRNWVWKSCAAKKW